MRKDEKIKNNSENKKKTVKYNLDRVKTDRNISLKITIILQYHLAFVSAQDIMHTITVNEW